MQCLHNKKGHGLQLLDQSFDPDMESVDSRMPEIGIYCRQQADYAWHREAFLRKCQKV